MNRAPTVLIADDSTPYRDALSSYLRGRGYNVIGAADGEEALRLLRERAIDLVVCDLLMPRRGGDQFVAEVRADGRLKETPVIIVTAARGHAREREVRPLVQGWLTKPDASLAETLECIGLHLAMAAGGSPRPPAASLGGMPAPAPPRKQPKATATYLLRLDLEAIRRNLERAGGATVSDDDLHRALAARRLWRHSDEWWGAPAAAVVFFADDEVLDRREWGDESGGIAPSLLLLASALIGA